jgi:hypothetical protein
MNLESFVFNVSVTVTAGILLAVIFFIFREFIFKSIDLDGTWVYMQKTSTSEWGPYRGMTLTYLALLAREGNNIYGSAEKILEELSNGEKIEFTGKDRSRVKIEGHFEKRYLSKDKIFIHITEFGEIRGSSTVHTLEKIDENTLKGRFSSTISNQQGNATWIRRST